MKFIGHLDIMRYFQKAFRRAGIDVAYSQGYSPHQLISFAAPLGVGLTSEGEYLDMQLNTPISKEEVLKLMNATMAEGIQVTDFAPLKEGCIKSMTAVAGSDYMVSLKTGYEGYENFAENFNKFMSQEQIVVVKRARKAGKKDVELDIRPFVYIYSLNAEDFAEKTGQSSDLSQADVYENDNVVFLQVCTGSVDNLKPELVMEAFAQYMGKEYNPFAYQIHRMEVYANDVTKEEKEAGKRNLVPLFQYETEQNLVLRVYCILTYTVHPFVI